MSGPDGRWQIHVINRDGSDPVQLTDSEASNHDPAWSPDGDLIAFQSKRDEGNPEIYLMRADGSDHDDSLTANAPHSRAHSARADEGALSRVMRSIVRTSPLLSIKDGRAAQRLVRSFPNVTSPE